MIVVSDATPIISFLKINRLDILGKLFGEVLLPEAVYEELTSNQDFQGEAEQVKSCDFFKKGFGQQQQRRRHADAYNGLRPWRKRSHRLF